MMRSSCKAILRFTICGGPSKSIQVNSGNRRRLPTSQAAQPSISRTPDQRICWGLHVRDGCRFWGVRIQPAYANSAQCEPGLHRTLHSARLAYQGSPSSVAAPPVPATCGSTSIASSAGVGYLPILGRIAWLYCPNVRGCIRPALDLSNTTVLMKPGIYYMQTGGFELCGELQLNDGYWVCRRCRRHQYGMGWNDCGRRGSGLQLRDPDRSTSGPTARYTWLARLHGSVYKGILFFEDRSAPANVSPPIKNANSLGGGGAMTLIGTLYFTNTLATTDCDSLPLPGASHLGKFRQRHADSRRDYRGFADVGRWRRHHDESQSCCHSDCSAGSIGAVGQYIYVEFERISSRADPFAFGSSALCNVRARTAERLGYSRASFGDPFSGNAPVSAAS